MQEIKQDVERLLHNQRNLLDVMPEMVLLVHGGSSIEYMNPSAIDFFGDLQSLSKTKSKSSVSKKIGFLYDLIQQSLETDNPGIQQEINYNNSCFECVVAPFKGYKGDLLHWLFLRDITKQKASQNRRTFKYNGFSIGKTKSNKRQALEENTLSNDIESNYEEGKMVGSSNSLASLRSMVQQVAKSDATILITGESGTGKELIANLIRESSDRKNKPFLKINCNTINDSILESDLFGYEKGAFTGADKQRKGKFEVVDGGTIFLDEIGDISPRMQASLLRVLQDGEILRVGGSTPIEIDVRVIAATNRDLVAAIQDGSFRLDLYYRLNIINIQIPPLRDRKDDIVDLVTHFIRKYREAFKKNITFLPQSVMEKLFNHSWPGNVRELENLIQRAVLMAKGNAITEKELFFDMQHEIGTAHQANISYLERFAGISLKEMVAELEREIITEALIANNGNVATTAQQLQIGKTAFYDKMKRYGISAKELKY